MANLIFDVEEKISQFPQVSLKFEGKEYQSVPISLEMLERLDDVDTETKDMNDYKKNNANLYRKLKLIIPSLDTKTARRIDIRVVLQFIKDVMEFIGNPENFLLPEVKKKIESGEVKPNL